MGDTATLTRPVHFRSKSDNLRMIRIHETEIPDPLGGKGKTVPGLRYEFKDYRFIVDDTVLERDRRVLEDRARILGQTFEGDTGTLEFFREHEENGQSFFEIKPSEMAPPPDDALKEITRAVAKLDRPSLEALLAEERELYQRDVVIETAETALASIAEMEQPPPPQEG